MKALNDTGPGILYSQSMLYGAGDLQIHKAHVNQKGCVGNHMELIVENWSFTQLFMFLLVLLCRVASRHPPTSSHFLPVSTHSETASVSPAIISSHFALEQLQTCRLHNPHTPILFWRPLCSVRKTTQRQFVSNSLFLFLTTPPSQHLYVGDMWV